MEADQLKDLLINPKNGSKDHFIADCPYCGKEGHFYIHKGINKKGIENGWDCKKCFEHGNIITLLLKLDKLSLLDGRQVNLDAPLNRILSNKIGQSDISIPDIEIKKALLPIGFHKLVFDSDNKSTAYLKNRKFTKIDFWLYDPGFTRLKSNFQDYLIIPIHREGQIKAYVGRYLGINPLCPRYLNSTHDFNKLLFGYDELRPETKTVVLVEGIFDKISVTTELRLHSQKELKCLATFGKKISEVQLYLLKIKGIENLIFMYDGRDAVNDMKRVAAELTSEFKRILICYTGMLDPGESNEDQILHYLSEAKNPSDFLLDKVNRSEEHTSE